jgi:hypothetical protein
MTNGKKAVGACQNRLVFAVSKEWRERVEEIPSQRMEEIRCFGKIDLSWSRGSRE